MKIVIFGLTITSSWGNGHATTYRSLVRALAARGHTVHFVEKDVEWYRSNRDTAEFPWCTVHLYRSWQRSRRRLLQLARDADSVIVGSYFPDAIVATQALLEHDCRPLLFYDIDTPITIARLRAYGRTDYLEATYVPAYDAYLSFSGGPITNEIERRFKSPRAIPFYCSVDPEIHRPRKTRERFRCDLSYLGTYASDRQQKLSAWLDGTARSMTDMKFIVAGPQYPTTLEWSKNVRHINHVAPAQHPAFYSSSRFTLNLTRKEMITAGYSPSVRLFEAAACGAVIISDRWHGIEEFFTPAREILLVDNEREVVDVLASLSEEERLRIGRDARDRILSEHTSLHRVLQFERIIEDCSAGKSHPIRSENEFRQISGLQAASSTAEKMPVATANTGT
ncbi:CgeB family protein [Terriglobus albidus]|uniref:CgeB family protein n=1 Tax=Terriglobus albidus TaxID=1592106 RepID=UPI0021E0F566|nr:glycosyltransferase [Terriglobus albidus]